MKVLVLTQKVDRNATILGFFHNWIVRLAERATLVHVVCLQEGDHALPSNVQVHSLGKEAGASRLQYILRLYRYVWQYRHEYDAVFVHMNHEYVVVCGWLWRLLRKRIVLWYVHRDVRWSLRVATWFVDCILTAAPETFRVRTSKVRYVGHGIDTDLFQRASPRPPSDTVQLATVGRITNIKNISVAIRAIALLSKEMPVHLDIIGEPITEHDRITEAALHEEVRALGLETCVSFTGALSRAVLAQRLCSYDATINMTPEGGVDKVVLESLACGVPAFTSNGVAARAAGAYADYLQFRYGDAEECADKIRAFVRRSPQERVAMSCALREYIVANYDVRAIMNAIVNALAETV